ncbi:MAG: hypothetical protein RJA45_612, partial [Actinomycetota bacterium]
WVVWQASYARQLLGIDVAVSAQQFLQKLREVFWVEAIGHVFIAHFSRLLLERWVYPEIPALFALSVVRTLRLDG